MLGTTIVLAGCTVAAAVVTGARVFGLKRLVKHSTITDVAFTAGCVVVFAGTLTGTLVAILSGLMMAVLLTVLKRLDATMHKQGRKGLSMISKLKARWAATANPLDDEIDENGVWMYNKAPYV